MTESRELLRWLRAAAEPTRLRLLALCAARELSVSDLAKVLAQSEPRVSRHLRILTEASLLERVRQGQWVHYRIARGTPAAGFVQGLLGQLDHSDPPLLGDRQRAQAQPMAWPGAWSVSRLGRELQAVLETEMNPRPARVLFIGLEHPQILAAARHCATCAALVYSRRAAQAARAAAERERQLCRIVQTDGAETLLGRDLARAGTEFDAVVIDLSTRRGGAPEALLAGACAALVASGRLWLFERYEAAPAGVTSAEHPIARLRRRLAAVGLQCRRIRPIEADGEHVLVASAARPQVNWLLERTG